MTIEIEFRITADRVFRASAPLPDGFVEFAFPAAPPQDEAVSDTSSLG